MANRTNIALILLLFSALSARPLCAEPPRRVRAKPPQDTELKAVLAHELSKGDVAQFQKYLSYIIGPSANTKEYFMDLLSELAKENPTLFPGDTLSNLQKNVETGTGARDTSFLDPPESSSGNSPSYSDSED